MPNYLEYGKFRFGEVTTEEQRKKIYRLRYEVYAMEFGFENPYDFPDKLERDDYDAHSVHFIALNEDDDIVGTVRMILNSEKGFPIEHAAKITRFKGKPEPDKITEISRLAVAKTLRRRSEDGEHGIEGYIPQSQGGTSDKKTKFQDKRQRPAIILGLYRAVYHKCKELGLTHMYMITDEKLFHALKKFGFIFFDVGDPVEYHGKRIPYATSWSTIEKYMHANQMIELLDFLMFNLDQKHHPSFIRPKTFN
jgi:N-acyl amino acid synthase of PEP-CTERM/exosortase system